MEPTNEQVMSNEEYINNLLEDLYLFYTELETTYYTLAMVVNFINLCDDSSVAVNNITNSLNIVERINVIQNLLTEFAFLKEH